MDDDTQPRWLSEEEQLAWVGVTAMMWLLPGPLDAQLQRDSDLNLFDYFVLSSLSQSESRQRRMSDLAAQSNASPSRLSNAVGRLEAQGWLTRHAHEHDRRSIVATLTDAGYDKVVASAPGHAAEVRRLLIDGRTEAELTALRDVGASVARAVLGDRCAETVIPGAAPPADGG